MHCVNQLTCGKKGCKGKRSANYGPKQTGKAVPDSTKLNIASYKKKQLTGHERKGITRRAKNQTKRGGKDVRAQK